MYNSREEGQGVYKEGLQKLETEEVVFINKESSIKKQVNRFI